MYTDFSPWIWYSSRRVRLNRREFPDRGRAALPCSRLQEEFDEGVLMYGYFLESRLIGFLGIKMAGDVCKLNDIIILPEYRNNGYGTELLDFCRKKAVESGKKENCFGYDRQIIPGSETGISAMDSLLPDTGNMKGRHILLEIWNAHYSRLLK